MSRLHVALIGALAICAAATHALAAVSSADQAFANKAAQAGLAEVAAAKIALGKTGNADVTKFARRMAHDHTQANAQLAAIAQNEGIKLPNAPSAADQAEAQKLQAMSGADFDRAYISAQVAAHKDAVALFEQEDQSGQDPGLKQFAARALPILNDHLQMAESMAGSR